MGDVPTALSLVRVIRTSSCQVSNTPSHAGVRFAVPSKEVNLPTFEEPVSTLEVFKKREGFYVSRQGLEHLNPHVSR